MHFQRQKNTMAVILSYLGTLLLFFMLYLPAGISRSYSAAGTLVTMFASASVIGVTLKQKRNRYMVNSEFGVCLLYLIWPMLITVVKDSYLSPLLIKNIFLIIAVYQLFFHQQRQHTLHVLRCLRDYLTIIIFLNLLFELRNPEGYNITRFGLQHFYLLDNPNSYFYFYIFALMVSAAYSVLASRHIGVHFYAVFGMQLVSYFVCMGSTSTTGLICVAFYAIMVSLIEKSVFKKAVKYIADRMPYVTIIMLVVFAVLVYTNLIVGLMTIIGVNQTDITNFKSRIYIWKSALRVIAESPFLGHGVLNGEFAVSMTTRLRSAHDNYLQILYYSGISGLFLYLASIFKVFYGVRRHLPDQKLYLIYVYGIMAYLIGYLVEQNPYSAEFMSVLILGACMIGTMNGQKHKDRESGYEMDEGV